MCSVSRCRWWGRSCSSRPRWVPLGGELADRIGRRPLIISTLGIRTLLFLFMATIIYLGANYLIIALVFLLVRLARAVSQPGMGASRISRFMKPSCEPQRIKKSRPVEVPEAWRTEGSSGEAL